MMVSGRRAMTTRPRRDGDLRNPRPPPRFEGKGREWPSHEVRIGHTGEDNKNGEPQ